MKLTHAWNPADLLQSPFFNPLQSVIVGLGSTPFPGLADWNALLARHSPRLSVQSGQPLRFVAQELGKLGFESQYEPRCYLTGEVQTRLGNWHDLFNAMAWLTFPKAKAAINARHYLALKNADQASGSQRGRVRDMATLLDESGVIVVCADAALAELMRSFQWKELFWQHREQVRSAMGFYLFGHGLYEKALQPYVGMTGQGLILLVPTEFFSWALADQLSYLDQHVAEYLENPEHCLTPRELHPVPLLGIPGWSAENDHDVYYDNTEYFRACRRAAKEK